MGTPLKTHLRRSGKQINKFDMLSGKPKIPIVIVGAHTVGLGLIRALYELDVPQILMYYDPKDMGYVSRYATEKLKVPHPELEEDAFINYLLDYGSRCEKSLLIPASDAALYAVSKYKHQLDHCFIVACTDWEITRLYLDKQYTYALADKIGVPAPRTVVPRSIEEVEQYGRTIEFPCLVKPCQSHRYFNVFRRKMLRVNNLNGMVNAYQEAADLGLEVMLQEIIPGDASCGVNYNSYFWDGQPLVEFTARKVRNAPPDFGSPCVAKSEMVNEVLELGQKILRAMGFYGYSCTEFKQDPRDGIYKLMEVNGRHNLSLMLAVCCGLNFPELHYRHLVLGEPPCSAGYTTDMYWIDLTRDIAYHGNEFFGKSFSNFMAPYTHKHIFAIFNLKDLKPFIKRCADLSLDILTHSRSQ
jgi:D-aspartate ligase